MRTVWFLLGENSIAGNVDQREHVNDGSDEGSKDGDVWRTGFYAFRFDEMAEADAAAE